MKFFKISGKQWIRILNYVYKKFWIDEYPYFLTPPSLVQKRNQNLCLRETLIEVLCHFYRITLKLSPEVVTTFLAKNSNFRKVTNLGQLITVVIV